MPSTIEQLRKEFNDQELTILAVNVREDWKRVARWVRKKRVTVPVLLDTDGAVSRAYHVRGVPTVVLVSWDGRSAGRSSGRRDWTGEKGRAQILKTLSYPGVDASTANGSFGNEYPLPLRTTLGTKEVQTRPAS